MDKRSEIVYGRLTRSERAWLDMMAAQEKRTKSDMIRIAILEAAERRGLLNGERVTA